MSLKERAENSPALFVLGLLFTGFTVGMGAQVGLQKYLAAGRAPSADRQLETVRDELAATRRELEVAHAENDSLRARLGAPDLPTPVPTPSAGVAPQPAPTRSTTTSAYATPATTVAPVATKPPRWVRTELVVPAGFQNAEVTVDDAPARVLKRLPLAIDVELPDLDRPVVVRVKARGRTCEQSVLTRASSSPVILCGEGV